MNKNITKIFLYRDDKIYEIFPAMLAILKKHAFAFALISIGFATVNVTNINFSIYILQDGSGNFQHVLKAPSVCCGNAKCKCSFKSREHIQERQTLLPYLKASAT